MLLCIGVVSGSTAYNSQEHSSKACGAAREMLAARSSSKA
uniref:Protein kinase n=1 Tax=Rhizophora mucronata TaxID=61149 RepID=A0A2P2JU43_RHIMU